MRFRSATLVLTLAAWPVAARAQGETAPLAALSCTGCHAAALRAASPVPRIHGRKAAELSAILRIYQSGKAPATVMDRIARGYTGEEIDALAAWFASQKQH